MVVFKIQTHRQLALATLGLVLASTAWAQPAMTPPMTPPITPTITPPSTAPSASTPSAFAGYKALTDEPVENWKAANDKVAKIGGWREYAKQAQQPADQPASAATGKATDPAPKAKP